MSSAPEEQDIAAAWWALRAAINARYVALEEQEPKLCLIAKALYRKKRGLSESDFPVMLGPRYVDGNDATALRGEFAPAWASYLSDARLILSVVAEVEESREQAP